MNDVPTDDKLEQLLLRIKRAEVQLDAATDLLQKFCDENRDSNFLDDPMFISHKQKEQFASLEWTKSFEDILAHRPANFSELKFKTLALFDFIQSGDAGIEVLNVVKNDLRTFQSNQDAPIVLEDSPRHASRQTFLLVDDSQIDRMLIKKALMKVQNDLDFVELEDGTDVVDVIKLNSPCITLLDIRMPGIDGYDVLRLIRNDLDLKDHPVWMLSTSSDNQDIETALKTGANGYYSKPTSLSEYTKLATDILESAVT